MLFDLDSGLTTENHLAYAVKNLVSGITEFVEYLYLITNACEVVARVRNTDLLKVLTRIRCNSSIVFMRLILIYNSLHRPVDARFLPLAPLFDCFKGGIIICCTLGPWQRDSCVMVYLEWDMYVSLFFLFLF